jgi:hypothetical protein
MIIESFAFALFSDSCSESVNNISSLPGPEESAAFQIVPKRRAHMLRIASVSVKNIRQFVAVIAS